jgi:hypothetical protein
MADSTDGVLLLACPECRKVVALHYNRGAVYQGATNLDEHRTCGVCGNDMVETERDEEGRIILPESVKDGSVTRVRVTSKAGV